MGIKRSLRRFLKYLRNDVRGDLSRFFPIRAENRVTGEYDERDLNGSQFLVATKNGFYQLAGGNIRKLLSGQFYGISTHQDRWFVFQRLSVHRGRLVEFTLDAEGMQQPTQLFAGLNPGCHQIDFIDDQLYVVDTYNNRLLIHQIEAGRWGEIARHYPPGRLGEGRASANYAHMNSIWKSEDQLWCLFHNETAKTGRNSEIVLLDDQHQIQERISTTASNGHNVLVLDGQHLYCDSNDGRLVYGDTGVYQSEFFTRGLSVTEDLVVVGQSQYGKREQRDALEGSLVVLNREFESLQVIPMPGMVQEVRAVNTPDVGLSNCRVSAKSL